MNAFVCVYRQPQISSSIMQKVEQAALNNSLLQEFLALYGKPDCFYDWGDDPGFFAATRLLGNVNLASWGVCRPNVRRQLNPRDLVIYFCGKQSMETKEVWEYYYIGFGTVKASIDRRSIWEQKEFAAYKGFFNCLVKYNRGISTHYEPFGEPHNDWEHRSKAGYILFDPICSDFNLVNPLKAAIYIKQEMEAEYWMLEDPLVKKLHTALFFNRLVGRGLRVVNPFRPHVHIALHKYIPKGEIQTKLNTLRAELAELSRVI